MTSTIQKLPGNRDDSIAPAGAPIMLAVRGPTACAVGYHRSPLPGLRREANVLDREVVANRSRDERAALDWLSLRERRQLERLHNPRRRREWLAGRALAKQLIADGRDVDFAPREIEILPSADSRRPQVWIGGNLEASSLSISHSSRGVLVAFCNRATMHVGVDLCEQVPLSDGFQRLWFTTDERQWLGESRDPFAANRLWAVKEALYKACNRGEGFDPRQVNAVPDDYRYRGVPVACSVETLEIDEHSAAIATMMRSNTPSSHQTFQEPHP